jgi:putative colanic acid biosynthesis glycosyltransferase
MKILHINVRLFEGGAAQVARDLQNRQILAGNESRFLYGYGSGAKPSKGQSLVSGVAVLGSRWRVGMNFVLHSILGVDLLPPGPREARLLRESLLWADVIHLHAIHSYFLPFEWFVQELIRSHKPVVWTLHDFWPITGRCASLEDCDGWLTGCGSCQGRRNYPSSHFDLSRSMFIKKHAGIFRLLPQLHFIAPSKFVYDLVKVAYPEVKIDLISNSVDLVFERAVESLDKKIKITDQKCNNSVKILVVANDLSDKTKVDRGLIEKIIALPNVRLTTVGSNSPFHSKNIENKGVIVSRLEYAAVLAAADALLFTSRKDTFGLVMAEALFCGTPVLAVNSPAAIEVLGMIGSRPCNDEYEFVSSCKSPYELGPFAGISREKLQKTAVKKYEGKRMVNEYVAVYDKSINP